MQCYKDELADSRKFSAHFCDKLSDNLRKEEQIAFGVSNFFHIHVLFCTVLSGIISAVKIDQNKKAL
ncbi:hypothetical protein DYD21_00335 [Rhodohalobacter sp. SW132]|nr:hypothetical protein DYD21_00335 [Rhodohalobacter sp. SW132]